MDSIVEYLFASTVKDTTDKALSDLGLEKLRERWLSLFDKSNKEDKK